jgi:hypothetical protein
LLAIHSDQGRNFDSEIFKQLCEILEIRKTRTSPRNPKCNGQTERFNRSIVSMSKSYLSGEQTNWDLNLGFLAGAYRASPNETTGLSPNLLMLGREVLMPYDLTKECGAHAEKIRERIQKAHEIARKNLAKRRKDFYDIKSKLTLYKEADKVWVRNENRKEGECHKLQPLYVGPYIITHKLNDLNYKVQIDEKGKDKVLNHNKLKPYVGKSSPKWLTKVEAKIRNKNTPK